MKVTVELKDGLYEIWNGDDCDNYPYRALLAIHEGKAWVSEWTANPSHSSSLNPVVMLAAPDLFSHLGVVNYRKV